MCDPAKSSLQIKPDNLASLIYEHYQELARNEDRLFNERSSNVLTVQSILLAAFMVTLTGANPMDLKLIRTIIAIAGVIICIAGFLITLAADRAWHIWTKNLEIMEKIFKVNSPDINFEMPYEAREKQLKAWGEMAAYCWCISASTNVHGNLDYIISLIIYQATTLMVSRI